LASPVVEADCRIPWSPPLAIIAQKFLTFVPHSRFGAYEIVERIGAGGMASTSRLSSFESITLNERRPPFSISTCCAGRYNGKQIEMSPHGSRQRVASNK
jgi:hypothetical protein